MLRVRQLEVAEGAVPVPMRPADASAPSVPSAPSAPSAPSWRTDRVLALWLCGQAASVIDRCSRNMGANVNTPRGILDTHHQTEENQLCRAVTCKQCGKTTWAGCGQHIDQVMKGVPRENRCAGHESEPKSGSFLSRLFTR